MRGPCGKSGTEPLTNGFALCLARDYERLTLQLAAGDLVPQPLNPCHGAGSWLEGQSGPLASLRVWPFLREWQNSLHLPFLSHAHQRYPRVSSAKRPLTSRQRLPPEADAGRSVHTAAAGGAGPRVREAALFRHLHHHGAHQARAGTL